MNDNGVMDICARYDRKHERSRVQEKEHYVHGLT